MPEFTSDSSINVTDSISAFADLLHARIHFIVKIRRSNLKSNGAHDRILNLISSVERVES